jgi:Cell Wall Hydrolase
LKKILLPGFCPVLAIALFFGVGEQSAAIAQRVSVSAPVVATSVPRMSDTLPAIQYTLPAVARPLVQPLVRGTIFSLPLRPAPLPLLQPLAAMVDAQGNGPALDAEATCLATAVYFESMGEPLEGQLAVAQVVINRTRSGRYPSSLCGVVKQKAQFSFVRLGRFPRINAGCQAWRKAQAIARIAAAKMAQVLPSDVLWYHADYVAPSWGRRLARVEKIGAHIFYRA